MEIPQLLQEGGGKCLFDTSCKPSCISILADLDTAFTKVSGTINLPYLLLLPTSALHAVHRMWGTTRPAVMEYSTTF